MKHYVTDCGEQENYQKLLLCKEMLPIFLKFTFKLARIFDEQRYSLRVDLNIDRLFIAIMVWHRITIDSNLIFE